MLTAGVTRSLVRNSIQREHLPSKKGKWTGKPGDSYFVLDENETFSPARGHKKVTGAYIKNKYNTASVLYKNGEPDFVPFADKSIGILTCNHMPDVRTGAGGSYKLAEEIACKKMGFTRSQLHTYMTLHQLTWHECGDRRTIIAVPTEIHGVFKHSGGISMQKGMHSLAEKVFSTHSLKVKVYRTKNTFRIKKR